MAEKDRLKQLNSVTKFKTLIIVDLVTLKLQVSWIFSSTSGLHFNTLEPQLQVYKVRVKVLESWDF
jgi:hypothetical protein